MTKPGLEIKTCIRNVQRLLAEALASARIEGRAEQLAAMVAALESELAHLQAAADVAPASKMACMTARIAGVRSALSIIKELGWR